MRGAGKQYGRYFRRFLPPRDQGRRVFGRAALEFEARRKHKPREPIGFAGFGVSRS
jgi:hypothetical protein